MAAENARYWQHAAVPGVDLLRARFVTHRYSRHAHETFTLGLIEAGWRSSSTAAASEAGFADQAHLTRHFKRVIGVPPGAYQRERAASGVISTG
jgi:AraC-like DNA-binding protein